MIYHHYRHCHRYYNIRTLILLALLLIAAITSNNNNNNNGIREVESFPTPSPTNTNTNTNTATATATKMKAFVDTTYISPPASDTANQAAADGTNAVQYPTQLYPEIDSYEEGYLDVGDGHKIYYDISGNPNGIPCIFLHGGPGGGVSPRCRRFFDPIKYKIIIFDQRGSGKSIPNACDDLHSSLIGNTTPKLVDDINKLRIHLNIDKWGVVLGGSWGSTLALAYAETYPQHVQSLLLRGVFLFGPDEVDYLFSKGGTYGQNPQAWDNYCRYIQDTSNDWDSEKRNLLGAYWVRLTDDDKSIREAAASAFVGYELSISKTYIDPNVIEKYLGTPSILIPFAVMEVSQNERTEKVYIERIMIYNCML
jgi:proline iminopeptidase